MAVGYVQQADIAERRDAIVKPGTRGAIQSVRIGHRQAGRRGGGNGVEEFTAIHAENVQWTRAGAAAGKLLLDPGRRGRPVLEVLSPLIQEVA